MGVGVTTIEDLRKNHKDLETFLLMIDSEKTLKSRKAFFLNLNYWMMLCRCGFARKDVRGPNFQAP